MKEAGNLLYGLIRALARRMKNGDHRPNSYLIRETETEYGGDEFDDTDDLSDLDLGTMLDP